MRIYQTTEQLYNTKGCWQERTPRWIDIEHYVKHGWGGIFHVINWMYVGVPLGVMPPKSTINELLSLPKEVQQKIFNIISK